jgi:hypothetical protein
MRLQNQLWICSLVIAQSFGCANLSTSMLSESAVQKHVLQAFPAACDGQVTPVVRAQSTILTLPPAMRLSTESRSSFDWAEWRSSRSEARHLRAEKFAQAQNEVVAKNQNDTHLQTQSSGTRSEVIAISATRSNASTGEQTTDSASAVASDAHRATRESVFLRKIPFFVTIVVIVLGSLTWPFWLANVRS